MSSRTHPFLARVATATLLALTAGLLVAAPSSANVTDATSTTTLSVGAGETSPLEGLSVAADSAGEEVSVIVSTDVGLLSVAVAGTGASLDFGYSATAAEVAFSGTVAQVNAALDTITLTTSLSDKNTSATIDILARNSDGTVYSPVTEHFYEYIPASGITWSAALTAATTHTYAGQTGYLASVPSANINDLITSKIPGATNVWLGGQALDGHDGYVRVWEWAAGPLAGDHFTNCTNNAFSTPCVFTDMDGLYENWAPNEPNNYSPGEFHVVTNWQGGEGLWNDLANSTTGISGYVVEYGDLPIGTTVAYTGLEQASSSVFIVGPPDPVANLEATPGVGSATVSWDAPGNDGGSELTEYEVEISPGGGTISCPLPTSTTCEITGLTSGTQYTVTVTAINAAGESESRTVTVTPGSVPGAPVGPLDQVLVGEPYSDQVTSTGFPAPTFTITDGELPDGLTLNPTTGAITGTATTPGPWSVEITATNTHGSESATFSGTVGQVPAITTATVGPFTWGVPVDIDLTATGSPVPEWDASALPPGLTLDEDGRLHGTPTAVGSHDLSVTATNTYGDDSETFSVTVNAAVAGAPSIGGITPGDGTLTIDVTAPTTDGGTPITGYEYSLDGGETWETATEEDGTIVIDGLDNGTEYDVEIRAINDEGPSAPSAPASGTPFTTPDAPVLVSVEPGNGQITIDFDAGDFDGGSPITGYEYTLDGGETWIPTDATAGEEFVVDGLDNGTEYEVGVRAVNAAGPSASSSTDNVTPFTSADAPAITSVVEGDGELTVQFSAPDFDGGDAITGYEYSLDGGESWIPTSVEPGNDMVIDGLTNGTEYDLTVRAVNAAGGGVASAPESGTPRTVPDAPAITGVTPSNGSLAVEFDAPAFNGGSPVTGYEYTLDGGETWVSATVEDGEFVIDGLDNGTEYTVELRATNEAGDSEPSDPATGTPRTVADAPIVTGVTPGDGTITVEFEEPANTGGSPVTGYEYTLDGGETWLPATEVDGAIVIDDLDNGTEYTVEIRATNDAGASAPSDEFSAIPFTTPGAPTITVAEPGNRSVTVEFEAPEFDGGSPITGYEYSLDGGDTWVSAPVGPGESFTVYGLTNGTEYEIVTRAVNAAGAGEQSEPMVVTPARGPVTVPGPEQPALPDVDPGDGQVIVDGEPVDSTSEVGNGGWTVTGGGVSVSFAAFDGSGQPVEVDASTGNYQVYRDGSVLVSGSGFAPGSTVDVWLLSEPWFLGEVTVNEDGTFSAMFALPEGVDLGPHTIQVNGLSDDGESVSTNTGIDIVDAPVEPAAEVDVELSNTGADLRPAGAAALLLLAGLGLALMGRRRHADAGAHQG